MIKLGNKEYKYGLALAPMAGYTDRAMRLAAYKMGAEYTVTEMVSAKAVVFGDKKTFKLARIREDEGDVALQIFGSEPEIMAEGASILYSAAEEHGGVKPVAIDINMGCPVNKIFSNGEGSALMKNPELIYKIVDSVSHSVDIPVTVKIRAGWDERSKNAPEFAKRMEDAGADLITVHGRTRQQFYAPYSDNRIIAAVKQAVSVPVVGNGDLFSAADVKRMREETGCDGVMIARGAMGNPFLFAEILAAERNEAYTPPTDRERLDVALLHAADMVKRKGARVGLAEARKHMLCYCKGIRGASAAREALTHAESLEAISAVFDQLLEGRS